MPPGLAQAHGQQDDVGQGQEGGAQGADVQEVGPCCRGLPDVHALVAGQGQQEGYVCVAEGLGQGQGAARNELGEYQGARPAHDTGQEGRTSRLVQEGKMQGPGRDASVHQGGGTAKEDQGGAEDNPGRKGKGRIWR